MKFYRLTSIVLVALALAAAGCGQSSGSSSSSSAPHGNKSTPTNSSSSSSQKSGSSQKAASSKGKKVNAPISGKYKPGQPCQPKYNGSYKKSGMTCAKVGGQMKLKKV